MKKDKFLKRFLAFVLSAAMVLTYMPTSMIAFAGDEAAEAASSEPKAAAAEEVKSEPAPAPKAEEPAPAPKAEEPAPAPAAEEPAPAPAEESAPAPAESEEAAPASEENADAAAEESAPADETAEVTDEQAAEDLEEEEEEELEYPAQNFSGSANGVSVSVSAPEGALPEGTTMNVSAVSAASVQSAVENAIGTEAAKIKAVDITFRHEGKDIEPKKAVKVHMNASGMANEGNQSVVHIADNGSANVVTQNVNNGSATFKSSDFSIYVVVDEEQTGENARLNVVFVKAGGEEVTMPITKPQIEDINTYIYDPGVGNIGGKFFKGWATTANYTADTQSMTIGDIREQVKEKLNAGVTEGETVKYYAMVFESHKVIYRDQNHVTIKTDEVLYRESDTDHTYEVNCSYEPYSEEGEEGAESEATQFAGWLQLQPTPSSETVYQNGDTIDLSDASEDIVLEAKVSRGHWLVFNENLSKASYTEPQFVVGDSNPTRPDDPTRTGYTFKGWFTEDESDARDGKVAGTEFDFSQPITANTTVHAKWEEDTTADYTVVIWKQKVSGEGYDFGRSITGSGNVGDLIDGHVTNNGANVDTGTTPAQSRNVRVDGTEVSYTGFHYDHKDSNVSIKSDGTSVLNVYYNRNVITINFDATDGGYVDNENTGERSRRVSYTGLYEAPLTFTWPTQIYDYWGDTYNVIWHYGGYPGTDLSFIGSFKLPDNSSVVLNLTARRDGNENVRTYLMDENGEYSNTSTGSAWMSDVGGFSFSEKYTGFELDTYRWRESWGGYWGSWSDWQTARVNGKSNNNADELEIRYKRVQKPIVFMDGVYLKADGSAADETKRGKLNETEPMYYGADTTSYNKGGSNYYKPTYSGYVFLGWYTDDTCTKEYTFNTMPADGITVYAKWQEAEYDVVIHPNGDEEDPVKFAKEDQPLEFDVTHDSTIGNLGAERTYHDLVGWYSDEACTHAFDFDSFKINDTTVGKYGTLYSEPHGNVLGKIELYAKWRSKLEGADGINIVYDKGTYGVESSLPEDSNSYTDLAEASAGHAAESSNTDWVFSHWVVQKYENGAYTDTSVTVYPGDTFEVKAADAKVEGEGDDTTYTIQLRAEFVKAEKATPTHINFYWNCEDKSDPYVTKENIEINSNVELPAPPSRDGYKFLGWIKDEEGNPAKTTTTKTDLLITYDGSKYDHNIIAADELDPYEAMYALWEAEEVVYKVEFYYQNDNSEGYTKDDALGYTDEALTGSTVTVKDADKNQTKNGKYELVTGAPSVLSATVSGDGTTTLKLYFNINTADVTVHHYLRGTTVKVANDVTETKPIGSKYTADTTSTYQGKTLSVDASASDNYTDVDVAAGGTVINIYYAIPLTVAVTDKTTVYNGSDQKGYGVSATEKDDKGKPAVTAENLLEGDSIGELNYTPAHGTDAGEYTNGTFTKDPAITYGEGKTAGYYDITKTPGKLTITKAPGNTVEPGKDPEDDAEKVESGNVTVVYDGKSHTVKATATKAGSTVYYSTDNGETWTTEAPVRTEAGTTEYKIKATNPNYQDATNDTVYKLTVTKRPVNVVVNNAPDATYDGQEHSGLTEYKFDNVVSGQTASITYTPAKGTNAGDYTGSYSADTFAVKAGDEDVTANYELKNETPGKLKINRAEVTITTGSGSKTYDGSALTNSEAGITGLVPADEGKVKVTAKGSQTEIGSSKNDYDIDWGDVDQKNYKITANLGTLTVNAPTPTPPTPPTPDPDPTPTPTPTPGGGGGNPGGGGGTPAVVPAAVTPAPAVIDDTPAPQAEPEEIDDEPAPAAAPEGAWALINLICAALATVGAVVALLRKKEDDDEDEDEAAKKPEDEDEKDNRGRNMAIAKVLGVAAAAASVITFILTEDMSLPMVMTDKWTLLMAVLFAAQIGTAVANKKASESDDEDEEGAEA